MASTRDHVPAGWVEDRFTDLTVRERRGQIPKALKSMYQTTGVFPVVDQGRELIAGFVNDRELLFHGRLPAIVFGDHTRVFKYVNFPFVAGADGTRIITPRSDRIDISFLYYALCSLSLKNLGYSRHFKLLKEQVVRFPLSLLEQRKIAAILSSVDDAIEKTQAVIDQVQVVKRGLMQELLTRGLPGQHRRFKRTQVGEVPEDWEISRISEIARCHYGTSVALKSEKGGLPVLRMGNLRDGRVNLDDVKYLEEGKVSDDLLLSRCDVLFNRTNSADLVGKVSVFDHSIRASFASYLLRLRTEPNIGNGRWLAYLLNTGTVQKILRATATPGVSQVNISRKNLLATTVPVPPIQEQAAIVAMLDSIQHRVEVEQSKVERLAELKIGLMSVLLTGELRVTPDPEAE